MWRCTGRSALLIAAVAAGCGQDADAVITVSRVEAREVAVQLCPIVTGVCGPSNDVFAASDPTSLTQTVGIYLDEEVDELWVRFSQLAVPDNFCHQVSVSFAGEARTPDVILPATAIPATVTGCDDCEDEVCSP